MHDPISQGPVGFSLKQNGPDSRAQFIGPSFFGHVLKLIWASSSNKNLNVC